MENEIIQSAHSPGHFSARKTQDIIERSYFIPKLKDKVDRIVESCIRCIIVNSKAAKKVGFLTSIDKGDLPCITFSKYVWLYRTRSTGVDEAQNCLD